MIYKNKYPERLQELSSVIKFVRIFFPGAFLFGIIHEGYSLEFLVLIMFFSFLFPLSVIKSIKKTIDLCNTVIEENRDLASKNESFKDHLLKEDVFKKHDKNVIIAVYITAGIVLLLYIVLDVGGMARQAHFVFSSIVLIVMLTVHKTYELVNIVKFFRTSVGEVQRKENLISSVSKDVPGWRHYRNKWIAEIAALSLPAIAAIYLFYSDKTVGEIIALFHISYLILLLSMSYDAKKVAIRSLKIIKQYDDTVKEKLGLEYKPG
jgi:ABC-type multidrug transport system fused ATPase/permease subunit